MYYRSLGCAINGPSEFEWKHLISYKYLLSNPPLVAWKSFPESRFYDKNLRRAMMIGTDFNKLCEVAEAEMDPVKQRAIVRQLAVNIQDSAAYLPLGSPYQLNIIWPWVKNYYGDIECGFMDCGPIVAMMWIDPVIKKELGW